MEQKKLKGFPIGRIVKIVDGVTFGNKANSITKILAKPGIVTDSEARLEIKNGKHLLLQLCENVTSGRISTSTYNNKGCFYEHVDDMVFPNEEEKKQYRKNKKSNYEKRR